MLSPIGKSATELTDSVAMTYPEGFVSTRCPHWRFVFSSVFKEPKLVALAPISRSALVPLWLLSWYFLPVSEEKRYRRKPVASTCL